MGEEWERASDGRETSRELIIGEDQQRQLMMGGSEKRDETKDRTERR